MRGLAATELELWYNVTSGAYGAMHYPLQLCEHVAEAYEYGNEEECAEALAEIIKYHRSEVIEIIEPTDPAPWEIEAECLAIQETWDETERRHRAGLFRRKCEPRVVVMATDLPDIRIRL